ncbi:MAG: hypothetical protein DHS20C15_11480 [Planctomycetota bacterium]|nr:MAG: hypothetical protein DHS20C15_11480 [Planctomycetota bacterium]
MLRRALTLLFCLSSLACSSTWWSARGTDAGQVLQLGLGASLTPGLYVHAQAPLFGSSLGWMRDGAYIGSDYGYTHMWRQAAHGALVGGEIARAEWPLELEDFGYRHDLDAYWNQSQFVVLNVIVTEHRGVVLSTLPLARFEVGAHALFVGASLGLDVVELADFLVGWIGFDPMGDEGWEAVRAPFEPKPEPAAEAN